MITAVKQFKTSDNATFNSMEDAKRHELNIQMGTAIKNLLSVSFSHMRTDDVVKHMLLEHDKLIALLSSYRKKLPRGKQQKKINGFDTMRAVQMPLPVLANASK